MNSAEYLNNLFGLHGEIAVIIGGAGVLGQCLASGLGNAGAKLVIADTSPEACEQAVAHLRGQGIESIAVSVDTTCKESLTTVCQQAKEWGGKVDILVNCAGINVGNRFLEVDPAQWDKILAVNLKGTMLACQVFIESMLQTGGGSILNIGSVNSDRPLSRVFAYAASKAAVVNLTQNIAQEFAAEGIRVNAICPGFFPAEQNRKLLDEKRIEKILTGTPMNRFGDPNELIGAALLLLNRRAGSYITGTALYVDGGFTCSWF